MGVSNAARCAYGVHQYLYRTARRGALLRPPGNDSDARRPPVKGRAPRAGCEKQHAAASCGGRRVPGGNGAAQLSGALRRRRFSAHSAPAWLPLRAPGQDAPHPCGRHVPVRYSAQSDAGDALVDRISRRDSGAGGRGEPLVPRRVRDRPAADRPASLRAREARRGDPRRARLPSVPRASAQRRICFSPPPRDTAQPSSRTRRGSRRSSIWPST